MSETEYEVVYSNYLKAKYGLTDLEVRSALNKLKADLSVLRREQRSTDFAQLSDEEKQMLSSSINSET